MERDVESKHSAAPTIKTYEVLRIEGSLYRRLIAIGDQPISSSGAAMELRKLEGEMQKRQHESDRDRRRRIAKYEKAGRRDHAMSMSMVDAFDFQPAGETNVNGHDCRVLDARPKPGYQPKDREIKVLAGMRGGYGSTRVSINGCGCRPRCSSRLVFSDSSRRWGRSLPSGGA